MARPHSSKSRTFLVTRLSLAGFPDDPRRTIKPEVPVRYTYRDFKEGKDPVLEAALAYAVEPLGTSTLEDDAPARYEGRYLFNPSQIMTIRRTNGRLSYSITDFIETSYLQFQSDLLPVSETELASGDNLVGLRFSLNEDEEI